MCTYRRKEKIELRKQVSEMTHIAEKAARPPFCLFCGKKTSLCNSHIVPKFILKNIDEKGMVCYSSALVKDFDDIFDSKKGINNAFTFHLICRECDKKLFAHYEDPRSILEFEKLDEDARKVILIEMAMKTHLAHIFRKVFSYSIFSRLYPQEAQGFRGAGIRTGQEIDNEEHMQYLSELLQAKDDPGFDFELLYDKMLDYDVGIATQTIIAYVYDLKGNMLFSPFDHERAALFKYFYLMILPINGKTRIFFYIEKENLPKVKNIIEQFNALTEEEKLHFLFISLIVYDEQFYINPVLLKTIKKDKKLCKLFVQADASSGSEKNCRKIKNFRKYNNYLRNQNPQRQYYN